MKPKNFPARKEARRLAAEFRREGHAVAAWAIRLYGVQDPRAEKVCLASHRKTKKRRGGQQ